MNCPICQSKNLKVVKTLPFRTTTLRIRVCCECYKTFRTKEDYAQDIDSFDLIIKKVTGTDNLKTLEKGTNRK